MVSWSEIRSRVGGPRAVSLTAFLVGSPFWILGFVFNETASYTSLGGALLVGVVAIAGQVAMGLVLWLAHLSVLRHRSEHPVALWRVMTVWGLSGLGRWAAPFGGLVFFDLDDPVPAPLRALVSLVLVTVGYGFGAYALGAYDIFTQHRARALQQLLEGEGQLATHRAAVESMKQTLVSQVDSELAQSKASTSAALDRLESSLGDRSDPMPALDDLRELSDKTWQRISGELWSQAPAAAPRVKLRELVALFAISHPFRPLYLVIVGLFLYMLVYSRVYGPQEGGVLAAFWIAGACIVAVIANSMLARLKPVATALFYVLLIAYLASSAPLIMLGSALGFSEVSALRIATVHAISVLSTICLSLPPAISAVQSRILDQLRATIDSRTLEQLHVESQLVIVSQKIANHLHGDVRGNFLAAVLTLRRNIDSGDVAGARESINQLRASLLESSDFAVANHAALDELRTFLDNWSGIIDIAVEKPLTDLPEEFHAAFHTIIVDGVNNAVRHGGSDWVRVTFLVEPDAIILTIRNNGTTKPSSRIGLGTNHLDLFAPDQWSRTTAENGITQLIARVEGRAVRAAPLAR